MMTFTERIYAAINLDALCHNLEVMKRQIRNDTKICAVIKANGYGHGALPIAQRIESEETLWGFAVAALPEAVQLREGGITKPILILGYTFPEDYEILIRYEVRPAVFTIKMIRELGEAVKKSGYTGAYPIHLAADTGMSRIGFANLPGIGKEIAQALEGSHLAVEGVFSHFARADEEDKSNALEAMRKYLSFCDELTSAGISIPIRHLSNSAGILELPEAHFDMVRAGITLYGIYPSDEMRRDKDLRPVMSLKSRVIHVKEVEEGVPVSYGGTYVTSRPTKIATISAGYADGYPRSLSSRGQVLIHGQRADIIGRVCMDQFMVDVTGHEDVKTGDVVTLLGKDGQDEITADELGALSGRFPYEFVCDIGRRVPRTYPKTR